MTVEIERDYAKKLLESDSGPVWHAFTQKLLDSTIATIKDQLEESTDVPEV